METNTQMKVVTAEAADVYTIERSSGEYPRLSMARCAAALVSARVGHGIRIFRNGELCDYKRF